MNTKEFDKLKNLFCLLTAGCITEFSFGIAIASLYVQDEICFETYNKINQYFSACEECRVPEYVAFVDGMGREQKQGIPKETINFVNLFLEAN